MMSPWAMFVTSLCVSEHRSLWPRIYSYYVRSACLLAKKGVILDFQENNRIDINPIFWGDLPYDTPLFELFGFLQVSETMSYRIFFRPHRVRIVSVMPTVREWRIWMLPEG